MSQYPTEYEYMVEMLFSHGWGDPEWCEYDIDGVKHLVRFATREAAQVDIDELCAATTFSERYNAEHFRIVKVLKVEDQWKGVWHGCTRCGMDVKFSYTQDDGTVMYEDPYLELTCPEEFTPSEQYGWGLCISHTLDEQKKEA